MLGQLVTQCSCYNDSALLTGINAWIVINHVLAAAVLIVTGAVVPR